MTLEMGFHNGFPHLFDQKRGKCENSNETYLYFIYDNMFTEHEMEHSCPADKLSKEVHLASITFHITYYFDMYLLPILIVL